MGPFYFSLCAIFFCTTTAVEETPFNHQYILDWGGDHVTVLDQGREAQIRIDPRSGGGFRSKRAYSSGCFLMKLKVPQNAKGITTTFYLTSVNVNASGRGNHDELDFEFLGHNGPPYILSTNIFAQDSGGREQQYSLWFDPTLAFHEYTILWNQHQIVFFADGVPIRVFKNHRNIGARYPELPMYLHGSLWNGTQWLGPVDWSRGPFFANYRGFEINGCPDDNSSPTECNSQKYDWNAPKNWQLHPQQQKAYEDVKKRYMTFDYCKSDSRNNFPECRIGS